MARKRELIVKKHTIDNRGFEQDLKLRLADFAKEMMYAGKQEFQIIEEGDLVVIYTGFRRIEYSLEEKK